MSLYRVTVGTCTYCAAELDLTFQELTTAERLIAALNEASGNPVGACMPILGIEPATPEPSEEEP